MSDQTTADERTVDATAAWLLSLAVYWDVDSREWDGLRDVIRDDYRAKARRLLTEVEPLIRAQVAEQIAQAIETTIGGYPRNDAERPRLERGKHANDAVWAAQIARQYGREG